MKTKKAKKEVAHPNTNWNHCAVLLQGAKADVRTLAHKSEIKVVDSLFIVNVCMRSTSEKPRM